MGPVMAMVILDTVSYGNTDTGHGFQVQHYVALLVASEWKKNGHFEPKASQSVTQQEST